jgi:group I intron endonuclease
MSANKGLNHPAIYTITNTISGKIYVGQARNVRKRWHSHQWHLKKGKHRNNHLQRAWDKYGEEAFIFQVVINLSEIPESELQETMNKAEIKFLAKIPNSYNLMEAAKSGTSPSLETRKKLSEMRKKLWQDPEFRERRRISHQAACADPELQKRRSIALIEAFSTPESSAKKTKSMKKRWDKEGDLRLNQSAKRKANWQNEEYREQQSNSRSKTWDDPEVRKKRLTGMKAAWIERKARQSQDKPPDKANSD